MLDKAQKCTVCPRNCFADRSITAPPGMGEGFCKTGRLPVVARAAAHYFEEPCISAQKGSGTIFFSGCALKCIYCQNEKISLNNFGREITVSRLKEIFNELAANGVHNINLVTPTHFSESILEALEEPLPIPVIYNSSGYEKADTLKRFRGKIQIYMPDMKYSDSELAEKYSFAVDYPKIAKEAILEMFDQVGKFRLDENGVLKSGLLIRHLILPGHLKNTFGVIDWVVNTFEKGSVLFSLMCQYTPPEKKLPFPELNRKLTKSEYQKAVDYLLNAGIEDGYLQEPESANDRYIPLFDLTGI